MTSRHVTGLTRQAEQHASFGRVIFETGMVQKAIRFDARCMLENVLRQW